MTLIINIIVAVLLSFIAINCLKGRSVYLTKQEKFLLFILATGLFQTGGATIAGLNLSALRLLFWILLVSYVLVNYKGKKQNVLLNLPVLCYSLYLGWCCFHLLFFSPDLNFGVRSLLKLFYPLLILLLAPRVTVAAKVLTYLHLIFFSSLVISFFISGVSEKIPYLTYNPLLTGIFWPRATFADHASIMVGVGLALWVSGLADKPLFSFNIHSKRMPRNRVKKVRRFFKNWQYQVAILWLCASPIAVANRTGLLATSGAIATFLVYRYKLKAIPFVVGIFFIGLWIVLYLPSFRDSTFRDSRGLDIGSIQKVEASEIDSSGRFNIWEHLMNRFFYPNQIVGSGLGSTQQYMYTMAKTWRGPFGVVKVPHSEYVVLLCDLGLIGLFLYLLTGISALYVGMLAVFKKNKQEQILGLVVASSFVALFCAMGFDNPHLYALGVHQYPFAFLGMLLAVQAERKKAVLAARKVRLRR